MKILFDAVLRVRKHVWLFVFSLLSLLGVTIFSILETGVFGALAMSGSGFQGLRTGKIAQILTYLDQTLGIDIDSFSTMLTLFLIVGIFNAVFLFFSRFLAKILAVRICRDLRNTCFAHLQKLPLAFFTKYDRGKLSTRVITDANQIALSFNSFITNYVQTPFIVLCTMGVCLSLSWQLSIILFLGVPAVIYPLRLITRKIRKISHVMQKKQESFTSVIIDHLSGISTIKAYQLEDYSIERYKKENAKMTAYDEKIYKYDMMSRPITHFMMTAMLLGILFVGLHFLKMGVADLIVYCLTLHKLYGPFKQFAEENANVQRGIVAAERINDVLHVKEERATGEILPAYSHSLEFEKVCFSYGTEEVLSEVSFSLKKGEVLGIAGSTGSGKSTLLKLFSRLYDVDSGKIRIDGELIEDISLKSLREKFAVVSQEAFFFNDTIRSNLIFDKDISDEEIHVAAKKACIHDFIMTLEDGYDTVIEEMGKNLSGGQKQRLSIARALLRDASILLLDEATSALDAISEQRLSKVLTEMKGEMTQVIIAHRLSTIQHADKILFLEHGKVKAFGTLQQVMDSADGFAAMWEASKLIETSV
ncbi:ABC transporter ATP-binding protein/permease [bacterium]|nr:ABC transporter ATP-binding protein/permease [bacterium]